MLPLNSDPLLCIWACIFLSYTVFYLLSLLAPILQPISLYHNFPMLFPILLYFEAQFNAGSHFLKQMNYFDYEISMPKSEAKRPNGNLKPAYSKSRRVWRHKKHPLLLGNIRKFLVGSAISTPPLSPSILVEQGMCLKRQEQRRFLFRW